MNGLVLYPKPAGVTSHDVVARVRRDLPRGTRVGHAGTLDPFATGLLLVLLGRMTRAQRWFMDMPKTYRAVARLGWTSDTGDRDGVLTHTGRVPDELQLPTGQLMQRPPAYSAVKVGGERAYARARRGEEVAPESRPVTVYRFEQLWREKIPNPAHPAEPGAWAERTGLEVECSAGTYVRSLVADLGDAYCEELERVAIGPFALADADPETVIAPEHALAFLPERELHGDEAAAVGHGRRVPGEAQGAVRLTHAGGVVAIAEPRAGELQPVVVFKPR